jgi:flagellar biosynthesis/type III secretory pathway protein FliH
MRANWCWAEEKTLSDTHSPVHAAHTTAFKPMDFLSLARHTGGFHVQDFRSRADKRFHTVRVEAMPDNTLSAPSRWTSPEGTTGMPPAAGEATSCLPARSPQPPLDAELGGVQAEQIRASAFEEGLQQGRREGEALAQERLREQQAQAQQGEQDALRALLDKIAQSVQALQQQPDTLFEPLKRLALHLAEELVLGELQIGAQAIDRLVQRCVDELQAAQKANVCVELHASDLQRLQAQPALESDRPKQWRWLAADDLLPGSVRVRVDDAIVTDLVEHRLQSLAQSLLGQPQRWAQQTAIQSAPLAKRFASEAAVSDVQPRPAPVAAEATPNVLEAAPHEAAPAPAVLRDAAPDATPSAAADAPQDTSDD